MDYLPITEQLLDLLQTRGVTTRKDAMGGGGGGFCCIKDRKVFFLDTDASPFEVAVSCARAVHRTIGDLESIYLLPIVRDFIDKYGPTE
ncbi:MAG: hypothetical protein L0Y36_01995 [Planctomycetales bacterium]|nr:hypothetical protein [Planctomycetales bacterium]